MNIPSSKDWGEIDGQSSFDSFFGKSSAQAERMFQYNALYYQEELQSMPITPFNFYAPALTKYIVSERAKDDSDGASSFLHMVAWMLKTQPEIISKDTKRLLLSASNHIVNNQEFYDADVEIYGRFSDIWKEIEIRANQFS